MCTWSKPFLLHVCVISLRLIWNFTCIAILRRTLLYGLREGLFFTSILFLLEKCTSRDLAIDIISQWRLCLNIVTTRGKYICTGWFQAKFGTKKKHYKKCIKIKKIYKTQKRYKHDNKNKTLKWNSIIWSVIFFFWNLYNYDKK